MKKITLLILVFFTISLQAQETASENSKQPILYAELLLALAVMPNSGDVGLANAEELNYQYSNHLFTFRYFESIHWNTKRTYSQLPYTTKHVTNKEIGLMYGRRWIHEDMAFSVSGGLSYNTYVNTTKLVDANTTEVTELTDNFYGFPLEFNIKWFNAQKKRYRIYYMIPVGKPTAFGRSYGFKIFANINKHSYYGVGLTYGFGWHKKYDNYNSVGL